MFLGIDIHKRYAQVPVTDENGKIVEEVRVDEFVFILPYSPTLNAIKPLWKSLKRDISPEIYENEDHFRDFLTETFLRLSHRVSFAVDWIETFLPNIQRLR